MCAFGLGLVLALVTLEGVSRWYYNFQLIRDPALGLIVPPGHTLRSRFEGAGVARYEDRGVRRAADLGPPTGVRILTLGDSFTEAHQVTDDEVYTTVVERMLNRSGMPSAVLNFSQSGLSVADYVAKAALYRATFAPAWTTVQVHDEDFAADAWATGKTHFRRPCKTCPIEVVRVDLVVAPDNIVRQTVRWLRKDFALAEFLRKTSAFADVGTAGLTFMDVSRGDVQPAGAEHRDSDGPAGDFEYPIREELRMLAEAYDGRLTLLLLGWFDPADPARDTNAEAAIKRAAHELGISIACSKDEYRALAARGIAPYGFSNTSLNAGHMNAAGHAAAARVLARALLSERARGRL